MRWFERRRWSAIAGSAGLVVCALVALPGTSQAEGPYYFKCKGPLAEGKTIAASVSLSSRELSVGQQLGINWVLGDDQQDLHVPDNQQPKFDGGAHFAVTGTVTAGGIWTGKGEIDASGVSQLTAEQLRSSAPIPLGAVEPGLATAEKAGLAWLSVKELVLDVAPVTSTWNNDFTPEGEFSATYPADWVLDPSATQYGGKSHLENDIRENKTEFAKSTFTFVGTGVDLITDKSSDMENFELITDDAYPKDEIRASYSAYQTEGAGGARSVGNVFEAAKNLPYGKYTLTVQNKTKDKYARVDGFRVHASTADNLTSSTYRTVCTALNAPKINITVGAGGSTGPTPPVSPSITPSDGGSVPPSGTPSASTSASASVSQEPLVERTPLISVIVKGSPSPTVTTTVTITTTPTVAQVRLTPVGGANTGERPDSPGGLLVLAGALMLAGSVGGGIRVLRRRAAHSDTGN